ncbi:serine/threonine-protein kinase [Tundrisphaera sp. TA3]|uniref:serine/threonine-protein kinase n=1 Tax=Tundrisphaera sp. TA3 TaxID=3435775 RepID=UPI003EBF4421
MIGKTLNQRFTLDLELGRGGMGSVFRATDQVLQRSVAIKILKDRAGEEISRKIRLEAQILARLLHENIVRLYDFGEAEGTYFFVMEEVDGSSFSRRARHLDLAGRLAVLAQVADALDYAHHQGVIHRDVKPANVLLTATDVAKLSDFGLSLTTDAEQKTGVIKGTPQYMSPEQARGGRLDFRTDLYSLGIMAYECATGSTPFQGASMAVIANQVHQAPEPPRSRNPAISPALEALILRLIAKDPAARPATGAEAARLIRELLRSDATLGGDATIAGPSEALTARISVAGTVAASQDRGDFLDPTAVGLELAPTIAASVAAPASPAPADDPPSVARGMLADVVADPVALTPDERYLQGHYLAYFLGGSRRRGFLRRRPLDPLNADRARLILAMAWLMTAGPTDETVARAAILLESDHDVRPSLSPVVVTKYLNARDTPAKRKLFRTTRRKLQEASPEAAGRMTDERGMLNPGLIPQTLDDLRKVAPARTEVDDRLVGRWNRVAEVWRARPDFRRAVLGYATQSAWRDPASADLWPEVVYPLIERARWQRKLRSRPEVAWDQLRDILHLPDTGVRFDRAIRRVVPAQVVEQLDLSLGSFEEEPQLDADIVAVAPAGDVPDGRSGSVSLHELAADVGPEKGVVRLADPDPIRLTMGQLRELWQEAAAAMKTPGARVGHRKTAIGPYHLAVIPSIRGRSAGEVAIQGMGHKQIEMLTPSIRLGSDSSKPIIAAWVYRDQSLVVTYLDQRNVPRYISWHAPTNHQTNYDDPGQLNSDLLVIGLEAPDQLDRALSKRFRPRNKV